MSVRTNQYILVGVRIPYEKGGDQYEKFEPFIDTGYDAEPKHHDGLAVVFDGMSGGYILIGYINYRSGLDENLDGPIRIQAVDDTVKEMLAGLINVNFPWLNVTADQVDPWFVTHYH